MLRRVLTALALIAVTPAASPAQAVGPPRPVAPSYVYVFVGPYRYTRYYGSDWAKAEMPVGTTWVFVGWTYWPWS